MSAGFIDETWYPLQLYDKIQDITEFSKAITRAIAAEQHFSIQLIDSDSKIYSRGLIMKTMKEFFLRYLC